MNASRLLRGIHGVLVTEMNGDGIAIMASEPDEAVELLGKQGPAQWGVALVWQGYGGPSDGDLDSVQANRISAFVRVPTGLPAVPGDVLTKATPGDNPSVLDRIEWVNVVMRAMSFQDAGMWRQRLKLTGSKWYRKEDGKLLRIHELEFEITAGMDESANNYPVTCPAE